MQQDPSPVWEKGYADSGTGRWSVLKIPTMSFYEYCRLLDLDLPILPDDLRLSELAGFCSAQLGDLMNKFIPLQNHFNRYLTIGGFPELVLADDDDYAQRMLREDVVDKVIKRDVLSLFNIRSPLLMEKLFLYLCMKGAEIFNATTAAKELENTSITTIESYIKALEMSNPRRKILCEVKYRNHSHIVATDAIVELCRDEKAKVTDAFLITKRLDDFGITKHETLSQNAERKTAKVPYKILI